MWVCHAPIVSAVDSHFEKELLVMLLGGRGSVTAWVDPRLVVLGLGLEESSGPIYLSMGSFGGGEASFLSIHLLPLTISHHYCVLSTSFS